MMLCREGLLGLRRADCARLGMALNSAPILLADFFAPSFQILFHLCHELVGYRTVDEAVIVAQGEVNHGADGNGVISILVGHDHCLLHDSTHAHDGCVRLVDDWQTEYGSELSGVGDGEGGTFDIFGLELLVAGPLAEVGNSALQSEEVEIAGVLEDGNNKSPVEGDGDSDIDIAMISNVLAFDGGIKVKRGP
jgi:hypothetical protein